MGGIIGGGAGGSAPQMTGLNLGQPSNFTFSNPTDGSAPVMGFTPGQLGMQTTPGMPGGPSPLAMGAFNVGQIGKKALPFVNALQPVMGGQKQQGQGQGQERPLTDFRAPQLTYIPPPQDPLLALYNSGLPNINYPRNSGGF